MGLATIALHPLTEENAAEFRKIRLKALKNHPEFFSATLEKNEKQPDDYWTKLLDGEGKCIFGLFDDSKLIGIAGIFTEDDPADKLAGIHMVYIEPEYRGRKLTRPLYEACIEWARKNRFRYIYVSHREGNIESQKAIERYGFAPERTQDKKWPDGKVARDHVYKLDL